MTEEKSFQPAIDTIRIAEDIMQVSKSADEAIALAACVLAYVMDSTLKKEFDGEFLEILNSYPGIVAATRIAAKLPIN